MGDSSEQPSSKRTRTDVESIKGAVVTGGASGIGLATVKLLSAKGYRVMIADRDVSAGEKEAANLGQLYKSVDVSDEASIVNLAEHAKGVLPNLSCLVNCAGCDFYCEFGAKFTSAFFDRTLQVNLRSMFLMCREMLPLLKETRGSIVNIASTQATRSFVDFASYAASKGGIISMSRQLAGDLARYGIRVNTVSPGATHSALARNSCKFEKQSGDPDEILPAVGHDELLGVVEAEEVAEAVISMLHLRGVTGQDLVVDGGCSIIGVPWWRPFPQGDEHPQIPRNHEAVTHRGTR